MAPEPTVETSGLSDIGMELKHFDLMLYLLKGLYVILRKCLLTMTPVAVKSTAVGILLAKTAQ